LKQEIFTADELKRFRSETIGCNHVNHLNNAGSGLMPDVVTQALLDHATLESTIGGYEAAALQAEAISTFYKETALLINCKPTNIAFTSSATDAYSRALSSIPFTEGDVILTDKDDFISNQIQFLSCQKRFGVKIVHIKNADIGGVDLADLEEKLFALKPKLFAITHIPTNSGLVQPVDKIAEIYGRYEKLHGDQTWYILDACQSIGQMKLDVKQLKCDFLSATNRKFLRGPRGTGFLFIADKALEHELEPLFIDMRGAAWIERNKYKISADARRFEDWEFAYMLVIASAKAVAYCRNVGEDKIRQQIKVLSDSLRNNLAQLKTVRLLDRGPETSSTITFTVEGFQPDFLVNQYLKKNINVVASYKNYALLDFEEKKADWAIRVSPHYYNSFAELEDFTTATIEILGL
jgi:selenocysteine lyase/cysteine desulfurase